MHVVLLNKTRRRKTKTIITAVVPDGYTFSHTDTHSLLKQWKINSEQTCCKDRELYGCIRNKNKSRGADVKYHQRGEKDRKGLGTTGKTILATVNNNNGPQEPFTSWYRSSQKYKYLVLYMEK